ncbi:MAG: AtpZ/AtpI family protein [Anaerolineae bacterium]|nr:AtpZ/AtpI family protein [Anaerolineae bacterium]
MKKWEALSEGLQLSWVLLFSLLIPLLAGIWLDKRLDTAPLFILIGMILGILAATVGVARMVVRTFAQVNHPGSEQASKGNNETPPSGAASNSEMAEPADMEETD